ncbi:MAG: hypothetical protein MI725_01550 [Pirellulales bacterium]|nr:hypothetical protein [Pirellulales bacterium]
MASIFPRIAATSSYDSVSDRIDVLTVGPWQSHEFSEALREVHESVTWRNLECLSQAWDYLEECSSPPELILLAQPLPRVYRQDEINRLQALTPLSRIVVVAGTWCEGEMRSGAPLSGVLRLYWYEFAPWWTAALGKLSEGTSPPWSMPLDSPRAGRYSPQAMSQRNSKFGLIAVSTTNSSSYDTFAAMLPAYGFSSVWVRDCESMQSTQKFQGGIWDGGQFDGEELRQLTLFCQQMKKHRRCVIALLDFPRAEHFQQARDAGAWTVLGKPFVVAEIVEALS